MIILKPGLNSCVFTLNEKFDFYTPSVGSYPDPYYYFKLTNDLTGNTIEFTSANDNGDGVRYNDFFIDINNPFYGTYPYIPNYGCISMTGSNDDLLSQWQYEVWGCSGPMPDTGTVSLPTGGTYSPALLESGRALYKI